MPQGTPSIWDRIRNGGASALQRAGNYLQGIPERINRWGDSAAFGGDVPQTRERSGSRQSLVPTIDPYQTYQQPPADPYSQAGSARRISRGFGGGNLEYNPDRNSRRPFGDNLYGGSSLRNSLLDAGNRVGDFGRSLTDRFNKWRNTPGFFSGLRDRFNNWQAGRRRNQTPIMWDETGKGVYANSDYYGGSGEGVSPPYPYSDSPNYTTARDIMARSPRQRNVPEPYIPAFENVPELSGQYEELPQEVQDDARRQAIMMAAQRQAAANPVSPAAPATQPSPEALARRAGYEELAGSGEGISHQPQAPAGFQFSPFSMNPPVQSSRPFENLNVNLGRRATDYSGQYGLGIKGAPNLIMSGRAQSSLPSIPNVNVPNPAQDYSAGQFGDQRVPKPQSQLSQLPRPMTSAIDYSGQYGLGMTGAPNFRGVQSQLPNVPNVNASDPAQDYSSGQFGNLNPGQDYSSGLFGNRVVKRGQR